MTKPKLTAEMHDALVAAAHTNTIDGPRGRALAVIRVGLDRHAKYVAGRHVIVVNNRPVLVAQAVDLANEVLKRSGLSDCQIDYPGAQYQSYRINGANDNFADGFARADAQGGA